VRHGLPENPDVIPGLVARDEISMEGMRELLAGSGIVAGKKYAMHDSP
jgi:hypothetical protein